MDNQELEGLVYSALGGANKALAQTAQITQPVGSVLGDVWTSNGPGVAAEFKAPTGGGGGASVANLTGTAETLGGAAVVGVAVTAARSDHKHAITNPAIDTLAAATDITTGNVTTSAHGLAPKAVAPAAGLRNILGIDNAETTFSNKALFDATVAINVGGASTAGVAMTAARRDHNHGIGDKAVTLAKMNDMATASLIGRTTAATGVPEILSVSAVQTLLKLPADTITELAAINTPTIVAVSANKTLALTDANKIQNVSTTAVITVPTNAVAAFPIGTQISVIAYTALDVSFVGSSGVTIRSRSGYLKIDGQYSTVTLIKIGTDEWLLIGALKA